MTTTVVRHHVRDYDAWRKVYDDVAPLQRSGGVIAESVYRDAAEPDEVLVLHRFGTADEARDFFGSAELLDAMSRAGVVGAPRVEFYDETDPPIKTVMRRFISEYQN